MSKYRFNLDPEKKGLNKVLGELETIIMELVWEEGEVTVREVHTVLHESRGVAYTTVMTVMSRLADKGVLKRHKVRAAFVYKPTHSKQDFTEGLLGSVFSSLIKDFGKPAVTQFLEVMEEQDPDRIEELARLIKERQQEND